MRGPGISKVAAFFCLLYPALSSAFFFGLELTNPAGATVGALNPTQTGLLGSLAAAGAGLGLLGASEILRPRPQQTVVYRQTGRYNGNRYYRRRGNYRGKRQVEPQQELERENMVAILEQSLGVISRNKLEGCFERLFCDIATKSAIFERDLPIVNGVRLAEQMRDDLSDSINAVSEKLLDAFDVGTDLHDVNQCELLFKDCQWTGEEMDAEIERQATAAAAAANQQG